MSDHGYKRRPRGSRIGGYRRPRVQVGFEEEVIKTISSHAKKNRRSFAAEVRALVDIGLRSR